MSYSSVKASEKRTTTFGNMWEYVRGYEVEKKCYAHYKYTLTLTRRQTSNPPRDDIIADAEILKVCDCLTEADAADLKNTPNWEDTFNIPIRNGQVETTILYDTKQSDCGCDIFTPADDRCGGTYTIPIWSGVSVTDGLQPYGSYKELLAALEADLKAAGLTSDLLNEPYSKCCPDESIK